MAESILKTTDVMMHFGGIHALQGVSLYIVTGNLQCIIGPNGAGKSTLFNVISGMYRPTAGQIYYEDRDIVGLPFHEYARIGITRKFQVPSVFESMTVRENLEVAMLKLRAKTDWAESVDHLLNITGLKNQADIQAGTLAHGQKQWLEIGMAVMPEPKLLLLDEPTAGMTGEETQKTAELLLGLSGNHTIVVIEHDMRFVRALDCHTIVMHQGKVLRQGKFADMAEDETVRDVYLGRR